MISGKNVTLHKILHLLSQIRGEGCGDGMNYWFPGISFG